MPFGAFSLPVRGQRSRSELESTDGSNRLRVTGRSAGLGRDACCDLIVQIEHSGNECGRDPRDAGRSEEHTSELQSLMRISYAVLCLKKNKHLIHVTNMYN